MKTVHPDILWSAHICSNCLNTVNRLREIPTNRIPARVKQSDILKIIMTHCRSLKLKVRYSHVEAHQDYNHDYVTLSCPAQLNYACDLAAKMALQYLNPLNLPRQQRLPLEPVCVWVNNKKITTDSIKRLWYRAQRRIARDVFATAGTLSSSQFNKVDWDSVHSALHAVQRMF